jgi:hypothetical protein
VTCTAWCHVATCRKTRLRTRGKGRTLTPCENSAI